MKIIVGLGNPGKDYEDSRHNIGFMIADRLCEAVGSPFTKKRLRLEASLSEAGPTKVMVIKPLTFMNLSGEAVSEVIRYYRESPESLLVIHDDLDLPLGRIKFSQSSSSGGHNGVASVIEALDTKDFDRLRVGIGRPAGPVDVVDYVLKPFLPAEKKQVAEMVGESVEAIQFYLKNGINSTMNRFN